MLVKDDLFDRGGSSFSSTAPQAFYKLLRRCPSKATQDLPAAEYKELLQRASGEDHADALRSLEDRALSLAEPIGDADAASGDEGFAVEAQPRRFPFVPDDALVPLAASSGSAGERVFGGRVRGKLPDASSAPQDREAASSGDSSSSSSSASDAVDMDEPLGDPEAEGGASVPEDGADGRPWNAPHFIEGQAVRWERHLKENGQVAYERIRVFCNNQEEHGPCCEASHTLNKHAYVYGPRVAEAFLGAWLRKSRGGKTRFWHRGEGKPSSDEILQWLADNPRDDVPT